MGNDLQLTGEVYQAISEDVAVLVSKYITRRAAKEAALQKIYDERQELRLALAGIKQLPLVSHTLIVEFLTGPEVASSNGNGNGDGSRGSGEKAAPVRSSQEIKYDRGIEEIEQDVLRTFPQLKFFHAPDGLLYRPFLTVLQSYSCFRPQIGYVQGMSYIVSMLLLNVDESEAFLILSNLMEIDNTRDFFTFEQEAMTREPACFNLLLASRLSKVAKHFDREGIHPSMYLFEWIMTMFSRSLSLEVSFRIWDSFLLLGYPFLLRTALGLIRMYRTELCASSFELILPLLQRPPQDMDVDVLFDHIRQIKPITEKELKATRTKANGLNH
jgi:hypothetical protein